MTVYASTDPVRENAAYLYDLRWNDILADLERQGVDGAAREALFAGRSDSHQRESGTRVVADAGVPADAPAWVGNDLSEIALDPPWILRTSLPSDRRVRSGSGGSTRSSGPRWGPGRRPQRSRQCAGIA